MPKNRVSSPRVKETTKVSDLWNKHEIMATSVNPFRCRRRWLTGPAGTSNNSLKLAMEEVQPISSSPTLTSPVMLRAPVLPQHMEGSTDGVQSRNIHVPEIEFRQANHTKRVLRRKGVGAFTGTLHGCLKERVQLFPGLRLLPQNARLAPAVSSFGSAGREDEGERIPAITPRSLERDALILDRMRATIQAAKTARFRRIHAQRRHRKKQRPDQHRDSSRNQSNKNHQRSSGEKCGRNSSSPYDPVSSDSSRYHSCRGHHHHQQLFSGRPASPTSIVARGVCSPSPGVSRNGHIGAVGLDQAVRIQTPMNDPTSRVMKPLSNEEVHVLERAGSPTTMRRAERFLSRYKVGRSVNTRDKLIKTSLAFTSPPSYHSHKDAITPHSGDDYQTQSFKECYKQRQFENDADDGSQPEDSDDNSDHETTEGGDWDEFGLPSVRSARSDKPWRSPQASSQQRSVNTGSTSTQRRLGAPRCVGSLSGRLFGLVRELFQEESEEDVSSTCADSNARLIQTLLTAAPGESTRSNAGQKLPSSATYGSTARVALEALIQRAQKGVERATKRPFSEYHEDQRAAYGRTITLQSVPQTSFSTAKGIKPHPPLTARSARADHRKGGPGKGEHSASEKEQGSGGSLDDLLTQSYTHVAITQFEDRQRFGHDFG